MSTVFIVDDHPVIRLAIRMLLEHEGYEIVGETDNGVDAMQMIRECVPDLIILDISIPKLDGLEVLARFSAMNSTLKTLVLTAQSPALFAMRCMQSGAAGYVCKQEDLSELVSAIKAVFSGYNYFPSQALCPEKNEGDIISEIELFKQVNDRELMVLKLFAQGKTNKEIATGMFLSNKTVSTYKQLFLMYTKIPSQPTPPTNPQYGDERQTCHALLSVLCDPNISTCIISPVALVICDLWGFCKPPRARQNL